MAEKPLDSFREKTISGVAWSLASQFGSQAVQLIIGVILARLLTPEDFGLIAMVFVLTGYANLYSGFGFDQALVHRQDITSRHYDSVFWLNIAIGILLTLLFIAAAGTIAKFYRQPELTQLTTIIAFNFIFGALKIVPNAVLRKNLDFRKLALINLSALLVSGMVGITMAMYGYGVWSLVCQSLLFSGLLSVFLWCVCAWKPGWHFSYAALKDLWKYSINLAGFTTINYWERNADNLLIGKLLGHSSLGIYSRAYSIMLMPLNLISRGISKVMFPALSQIQNNKPRVANVYLRTTRMIALITFPMMAGLLMTADHFVLVLFGSHWQEMIPIVQCFSIVGMLQSIGAFNGNIYLSQGRSDLQLKIDGTLGILRIVAIIFGIYWGVMGVVYAYSIFSIIVFYPSVLMAVSLVDLDFKTVIKNLTGVSSCTLMMVLAIWGVEISLSNELSQLILFTVKVFTGVAVYWMLLKWCRIAAYRDAVDLMSNAWQQLGGDKHIPHISR